MHKKWTGVGWITYAEESLLLVPSQKNAKTDMMFFFRIILVHMWIIVDKYHAGVMRTMWQNSKVHGSWLDSLCLNNIIISAFTEICNDRHYILVHMAPYWLV